MAAANMTFVSHRQQHRYFPVKPSVSGNSSVCNIPGLPRNDTPSWQCFWNSRLTNCNPGTWRGTADEAGHQLPVGSHEDGPQLISSYSPHPLFQGGGAFGG